MEIKYRKKKKQKGEAQRRCGAWSKRWKESLIYYGLLQCCVPFLLTVSWFPVYIYIYIFFRVFFLPWLFIIAYWIYQQSSSYTVALLFVHSIYNNLHLLMSNLPLPSLPQPPLPLATTSLWKESPNVLPFSPCSSSLPIWVIQPWVSMKFSYILS